jgi:hypothetical protein
VPAEEKHLLIIHHPMNNPVLPQPEEDQPGCGLIVAAIVAAFLAGALAATAALTAQGAAQAEASHHSQP